MSVRIPQTTLAPHGNDASENFWRQLVMQNRRSRRNHPRIHADISVHVLTAENNPIKLNSRDISFGGLQVRCNPDTSRQVLGLSSDSLISHTCGADNPVDGIARMKLELRLVVDARVSKIQCLVRVAHYVLVADALPGQEIAIGFQFLGFKDRGKQVLNKFIEEHMIPAGF